MTGIISAVSAKKIDITTILFGRSVVPIPVKILKSILRGTPWGNSLVGNLVL